jgi:hypothetical protein
MKDRDRIYAGCGTILSKAIYDWWKRSLADIEQHALIFQ